MIENEFYIEYNDSTGTNTPESITIVSNNSHLTEWIDEKLKNYPVFISLKVERKFLRKVSTVTLSAATTSGIPIQINRPVSLNLLATFDVESRKNLTNSLISQLLDWINEELEMFKKERVRLMAN